MTNPENDPRRPYTREYYCRCGAVTDGAIGTLDAKICRLPRGGKGLVIVRCSMCPDRTGVRR